MSNLNRQEQTNGINVVNGDGSIFYPKLSGISTTTSPLSLPTTLTNQTLYENYNLKWDEASLEQRIAAMKLETQKQLLNEFMLRKAQLQNAPLTYPTEIHLRTTKVPNQRNRELYKTALCDFWSAGIPCRFGERCWFAHGPHELRIARFVYPGLNPYDYEVRMTSPNTLSSPYGRRFWNLEQNYPVANVQPTPTTMTPMGQNVPIGYERKLHHISPTHENVNPKNWRTTQRGISDGDSGIGSTGTNNSPERENLDSTNYQFMPFQEPSLTNESRVIPPYLLRPLDTLANREQTNFSRNEAYNYWLSTGAVQSDDIQLSSGLEQMSWWPDTISNTYPFINRPHQNIQSNHNAIGSMDEQCYSIGIEPKIDKIET
ncbi:hypothetical protein DINM_004682 [Dirofilaria immitis]|nr:hypothetical protein [Dirofilaria immitis]